MSLLVRTHRVASLLSAVRHYAVSRPNPRPKDPVLRSPSAKAEQIAPDITFIHNPPSSVPTPFSLTTAPVSPLLTKPNPAANSASLPPALHSPKPTSGPKLSLAQIEEIKQLRNADPKTNSCQALGRRFGCSAIFVSMIAPLKKEQHKELERERNVQRAQWGERKQLIREIRRKRREHW